MVHRGWLAGLAAALAAAFGGGCEEETVVKDPITIGLIAPKSGALATIGASFERVANVAVAEINAKGGVNGHPLVLVTLDDGTDATMAAARMQEMIDMGVVAVIGPATSGAVQAATDVARPAKMPFISPSSTSPDLATYDDDGFMLRNVPNDSIQGIAMAYYLTQKANPAITSVVVVHEDTSYGLGLATAFKDAFTLAGGTTTATITYPQNFTGGASQVVACVDAIEAANPTMVVLIGLEGDDLKILEEWHSTALTNQWFFTDGARSQGFLDGIEVVVGLKDKLIGSLGTAPTTPTTGQAFSVLENAYEAVHDDDISAQVFAANVWDAVFQIAAGLAQQEKDQPGMPFGGEGLRDGIVKASVGPGAIQHAGQWTDLIRSIRVSGDVDYDGASGPCDFDADGETIGPYEVWKVVDSGMSQLGFDQELYLEAQEIRNLAMP